MKKHFHCYDFWSKSETIAVQEFKWPHCLLLKKDAHITPTLSTCCK